MGIRQSLNRWRGRRELGGSVVTPLGFHVKTEWMNVDLDYLDLVLHNVAYWSGIKPDSKKLPIEIMPPCPEHGACCFVTANGQHKHGEDDGKVIRLSQRMCVAHHLIGRALTGLPEGHDLLNVFDRLDWIGKDYE